MLFRILVTILASLTCSHCFAAYFNSLSIEDGLSQGSVFQVYQDRNGFLWLATLDGLNRYDGTKFIQFKDASGTPNGKSTLTSSRVTDIAEDRAGNLWVSSRKGLNYFNTKTFEVKHYLHDPQNPQSLPFNETNALTIDDNDIVWIASKIGLVKLDPKTDRFKLYQDNKTTVLNENCSSVILDLTTDNKGNIWIGNRLGLCKFDTMTEKFTYFNYHNDLLKSFSSSVNEILYNAKDYLWVGSERGLFRYFPDSGKSIAYFHDPNNKHTIPNNWITGLAETDTNQIWVGTSNGLSVADINTGKFINFKSDVNHKYGLSSHDISSIQIDQSGLILIGTNGGGLNIYNPRQQTFTHIKDTTTKGYALSDLATWEITKAFDEIWIGSSNGLNRLDPATGKIKHYFHDPNNPNSLPIHGVLDIEAGNNRDLWIGAWNSISHFTIDDEKFENYYFNPDNPNTAPIQDLISFYYEKKKNLVWIGSAGHGVTVFNPVTQTYTLFKHDPNNPNSLPHNYTSAIQQTNDDFIWLATETGITRYYPETATFKHIKHDKITIGKTSYAVRELANGNIAISSISGLSIINATNDELIKHYTIQDGLEDDYIYGLEIDNYGHIWVSTNNGLSRINPETNKIENFDMFDGLQGFEYNGDASFYDGEYLYFGGYNGFNYFKPDEINTNKFIPPVAITGFSIHNIPLSSYFITKPVQLSYKDNFFSIEFAALDFTNPKKNQYAYRLLGFDDDWVLNNNRNFASYTNLDGGQYTFQVKAANKYGIWNEQGVTLAITITPPFWKTAWFRVTSIILMILIIFSVYALRVRVIKARNKLLKQQVKARTEELENTLLELTETKDALIEAAHKAGMADTATAVLHNVGNLLNSVKTSAGLIREAISTSVSKKFLKANSLLLENKDNIIEYLVKDPKGGKILNYLMALGISFEKENDELNDNSIRLAKTIDSIEETIIAQQRFVQHGDGFAEQLSLIDIVEESLLLQTGSIGRHEIKIVRNYYDDIPLINLQKTKLVQILINLYQNAKESMDESKTSENVLTIDVTVDKDFAYICYTDTGIGIEADFLQKIFNHGFTTKPGGHGFGLHSCANYMTEMGGKMWAESNGPNQGATIILRFPLTTEDKQKTATAA